MNININRFIQNNTYIDKNEKSIIKFGIDMMITTIVAFIVAFIIAVDKGRDCISDINYYVKTICWRLSCK